MSKKETWKEKPAAIPLGIWAERTKYDDDDDNDDDDDDEDDNDET